MKALYIVCAILLLPSPFVLAWAVAQDRKHWRRVFGKEPPKSESEASRDAAVIGWTILLIVMALACCVVAGFMV